MKRTAATLAALAALALGLVVGAPAAEAAGTITPWQSSVAVGATFSASANGCPSGEDETATGYVYQRPYLRLLIGAPGSQRLAAVGETVEGVRVRLRVPGWVDPDEPATIAGSCQRYIEDDAGARDEVAFTFAPVPIDVVAGTPRATGPIQALSRTTAAGGQLIRVDISGCEGASDADTVLLAGDDPTLATLGGTVISSDSAEVVDGRASVTIELLAQEEADEDLIAGPAPEGPYQAISECRWDGPDGPATELSAPTTVTVEGSNPSESLEAHVDDDGLHITGEGCTGGRIVTVGVVVDEGVAEPAASRAAARAAATGDFAALRHERTGEAAPSATTGDTEVVPDAGGAWSVSLPVDPSDLYYEVRARCGDPLADGFVYVRAFTFATGELADVIIDRISPTSSPTGGEVTVHAVGDCEGPATVELLDPRSRDVLAESAPATVGALPVPLTLTAPPGAGTYVVRIGCDGGTGDQYEYEVFSNDPMSEGAGPAEPLDGWPEAGQREVYDGRLGPIELPAQEQLGRKALGPTELFIDVPRPEGDFAITEITFDLVHADGTPVDPTEGQIGYFAIMDESHTNPACPDGTFGLSGRLVAAAGTEKTVLRSPGPYGLVVGADDDWTGTYRLTSLADTDQEVFLSYRFEIRRDLENVRPITTYFGSTTGCSWFDYTLGGGGGRDVQTHYLTVAKDGRLIGAGGSLSTGGIEVDWTNDRGERICTATATYGDDPVVAPPNEADPPRWYADDRAIESISTCPLGELLTAGERLEISSVYDDARPRSGASGVYVAYVWEGGGPAAAQPGGADPVRGSPRYTG